MGNFNSVVVKVVPATVLTLVMLEHCDKRFTAIDQNLCATAVQPPRMAPPGVGAMNFANLGIEEQRDGRGRGRRVRVADPMDQRPCNHYDISSIGEHLRNLFSVAKSDC